MREVDRNVAEAIARAEASAKKISTSPRPNEDLSEIDYDKIVEAAKKVENAFIDVDRDSLIVAINQIINAIPLPDIEHSTASRGLLVAQSQGLELLRSLQQAKNLARSVGYKDPDSPNLDLNTGASAEELKDLNTKLDNLTKYAEELDRQMKSDKQIGITVGAGLISAEVGVLLSIVKNTALDVREYISSAILVNSIALQDKFEIVNSSAKSLVNYAKNKLELLGRETVNLTKKIAKAAADAYISGINLIKKAFDRQKKGEPDSNQNLFHEAVPDEIIEADLRATSGDPTHAANRILANIVRALRSRPSGNILTAGNIAPCNLFDSHSHKYLQVYALDPHISFTFKLSLKEHDVLARVQAARRSKLLINVSNLMP